MKESKRNIGLVLCVLLGMMCTMTAVAQDRPNGEFELSNRLFFFSIEEEFVSQGPEPADGNPIISDGDLLISNGTVYMRNAELLRIFQVEFDLGLDAVHVLDVNEKLVAFSTELDSPYGNFTAGDLLFTNGAVIPNAALLAAFDIPRGLDLGLDSVHLVGPTNRIVEFSKELIEQTDRLRENPGILREILAQYELDIWFSTEGTGPSPKEPMFLDGDLLSAAGGGIVLSNSDALPASVPAGIPSRGVDFGMDAYTRAMLFSHADLGSDLYSTEINGLFSSFTDGDIMLRGVGAIVNNISLINAFEPRVRDMGLDALHVYEERPGGGFDVCRFTKIGGLTVSPTIWDFATGYVDPDLSGRKDHAFGRWVSIRGELSPAAVEHRVLIREDGQALSDADPILMPTALDWRVYCHPTSSWLNVSIGGNGWMNSSTWRFYRDTCLNGDLIFVNFNSSSVPDGKYILTLQIRDASGNTINCHEVPIQVDNTRPEIVVPDTHECQEYIASDMPLDIEGAFDDPNGHFWRYNLSLHSFWWAGGQTFDSHFYYQGAPLNSDGTPGFPTPVALTTLDIPSFLTSRFGSDFEVPDGRYTIIYRAWDRTILGRFIPPNNFVGDQWSRNEAIPMITNFEFTP